MLTLATKNNLAEIIKIKDEVVKDMINIQGLDQWTLDYPNEVVFTQDIEEGNLYVYKEADVILAVICLNKEKFEQYNDLKWTKEEKYLVIHRFFVNKKYQKKNIGTKVLLAIEEVAKDKSIKYLKIDTNAKNLPMNNLINKCNYNFIGEVKPFFDKGMWNCYDKII